MSPYGKTLSGLYSPPPGNFKCRGVRADEVLTAGGKGRQSFDNQTGIRVFKATGIKFEVRSEIHLTFEVIGH